MRKVIIISFLPYCYCCCWTHCRCYCHGRCSGCCCSSRQQNTMALKDEPSPKCTFPGAETSLLKSYRKLAAATATAAALAAAAAPGSKKLGPMSKMCVSYCYCCCWSHCCRCYCHGCCSGCCCSSRQQNTMALKDEPSPKYTSCDRNVPSEILQRACCWCGKYYNQFFYLTATAAAGLTAAAATATTAAVAAAAAPGSKTPWP